MIDTNKAFIMLSKRAESYDKVHLSNTFVDYGSFFFVLSNPDHQVIYGRRGTGKTHALSYLNSQMETKSHLVVYIDMRTIGSTGGIYADPAIPLKERSTRLLIDTLEQVHSQLLQRAIQIDELDLSILGAALDELASAITEVKVEGPVEHTTGEKGVDDRKVNASANLDVLKPTFSATIGASGQRTFSNETLVKRQGVERHRVHFGRVQAALSKICDNLKGRRLWILLDEWSEVPLDIQPILADLIRRSVLPIRNLTVKISAIEQRSLFCVHENAANYIGIELGADISTSVNMDDYMVFDNDQVKAQDFFRAMFFRHMSRLEDGFRIDLKDEGELIRKGFSNSTAFAELVRAAEGVPRDAINIVGLAAQAADNQVITVPDVRKAAKAWYLRAKEPAIHREEAKRFLRFIVDDVISSKKAKAFLCRSDIRFDLIDELFDSRILHLIKKGVSTKDQPGIRYNVWAIDYGCYVDLINTVAEPLGLFEADAEDTQGYVTVPMADYRSIRRAILDPEAVRKLQENAAG